MEARSPLLSESCLKTPRLGSPTAGSDPALSLPLTISPAAFRGVRPNTDTLCQTLSLDQGLSGQKSDFKLLGYLAPSEEHCMVSIRISETVMNHMFISLVFVGSGYLHRLRKTALLIFIKIG